MNRTMLLAEAEAEARQVIVAEAEAAIADSARGARSSWAIFHATHRSNLPSILTSGALLRFQRAEAIRDIGDAEIKAARLRRPVPPAPGKVVADFVPFYFTPRSRRCGGGCSPATIRGSIRCGERGSAVITWASNRNGGGAPTPVVA